MREIRTIQSIKGVLLLALILRLIAAVFSKGYAFHDDHFIVLRVAESWSEGIPHWIEDSKPPKHSMLYSFLGASILWGAKAVGVSDPMIKATILQIIHGIYSLLIVWLGYLTTLRISTRKNALLVAQILAVLWFMPYLGVKFMAEMVSVPPLMFAFYLYLKEKDNRAIKWLLIGAMIGIAFSIRIHTIFLSAGLVIILIAQKRIPAKRILSSFMICTNEF